MLSYVTVFDNKFFYWRQRNKAHNKIYYQSEIFFDGIENLSELRGKTLEHELAPFKGLYPHLGKVYYDRANETMSAFVDYNTIKIWPLLHQSKIKLKLAGKRKEDIHILAT